MRRAGQAAAVRARALQRLTSLPCAGWHTHATGHRTLITSAPASSSGSSSSGGDVRGRKSGVSGGSGGVQTASTSVSSPHRHAPTAPLSAAFTSAPHTSTTPGVASASDAKQTAAATRGVQEGDAPTPSAYACTCCYCCRCRCHCAQRSAHDVASHLGNTARRRCVCSCRVLAQPFAAAI